MKNSSSHGKIWHRLFQIGVALKALDGLLETIGGLLFLFLSRETILRAVFSWTQHELWEDPDDWIANHLRSTFTHLPPGTKVFAVAYLLGHGLVKLALAVGLWWDKPWAFPAGLAVLTGFVGYQIFRMAEDFSIALCVLTVIDIAIIALVWCEYRRVKKKR
jgi:uncharacterized membrane protein